MKTPDGFTIIKLDDSCCPGHTYGGRGGKNKKAARRYLRHVWNRLWKKRELN